MKKAFFFLLLFFLIPNLVHAFNEQEYKEKLSTLQDRWNQHEEFFKKAQALAPDEIEQKIAFLKASHRLCGKAKKWCDRILDRIHDVKDKSRAKGWSKQKKQHQENKAFIAKRLIYLQGLIEDAYKMRAVKKARPLYDESEEKARTAQARVEQCVRDLTNVEEVVSALEEAARLYESASSLAKQGLEHIALHGDEASKEKLRRAAEVYQEAATKHKKEAAEWPAEVLFQQAVLKERLKERSSYEGQKEAVFESSHLRDVNPSLSEADFRAREKERKERFFTSAHPLRLESLLAGSAYPRAIPLDGYVAKKEEHYTLYAEQFTRFLIQSDSIASHLLVKVYDKGALLFEERIALPLKNKMAWERYLAVDGLLFIPETTLKTEFGLDLRMQFFYDPSCPFSMILSHKGSYPYFFSFSLDEGASLYGCNLSSPPPWQLGVLRKPAIPVGERLVERGFFASNIFIYEPSKEFSELDLLSFPVLDKLVEELQKDPLLLAQYVHHEIGLADPFLYEEEGVLQAPGIQRSPYMTYVERRGSPWEQCQLLVYLLRKAGCQAACLIGDPFSLPKAFVEKMLFTKLPEGQEEALLKYPWVLLAEGEKKIPLFPWMKEVQIQEGHDLYHFLPEEYASADRFIFHYLEGDKRILKHIGPDGDDTAAVLFTRFVEEELRKQGLSLFDVGIQKAVMKRPFTSWDDFPHPRLIRGRHRIVNFLGDIPELLAHATIEVSSHENPDKKIELTGQPFFNLNCSSIPIRFEARGEQEHVLHLGEARTLVLDRSDHSVDIRVRCVIPTGSYRQEYNKTFHITKGTAAAVCFSFGGESQEATSQFYENFTKEQEEHKKLSKLLAFVGAAYFEKCGRAEKVLADLHKVSPGTVCQLGLAKLAPDLSAGSIDPLFPQVDMVRFLFEQEQDPNPGAWHRAKEMAIGQWFSLSTVDQSSQEHQILREIFQDPNALSTIKLLQLSHQGFLVFTSSRFQEAENTPEAAKSLYFSHLPGCSLRQVKNASLGEWSAVKTMLDPEQPLSRWAYVYMTPGLTASPDGTYKEMGALIIHPREQRALISSNNLVFNGGLGSPLSRDLTSSGISSWQLVPMNTSYESCYALTKEIPSFSFSSLPEKTTWHADVRSEHQSLWQKVGDPVDVVTGAFYIDEVDCTLPGPFPLEIRRNYSSQNPLLGDLGCGWKLSLSPYLIEQDGKLFASEVDGTVLCYSLSSDRGRWEVTGENNPDLYQFHQAANPFHAYIENNVLYGADGSRRFFEEGLLIRWINSRGHALTFSYDKRRLSRIESSNGDFCGLRYNHEGHISEIYARDGRRISYHYSSQGDLVRVTLPNTAVITYEYDRAHRVIRETRPHGRVLENTYDEEGRVKEQRSPMGPQQEMIKTAFFSYAPGMTTVIDAKGEKTTYKIFAKQIYKITDPLGYQTLQSWFIDARSWFDPEKEAIVSWEQPGGAVRSLKATTDRRGLTTYYLYDERGNPQEIGFQGEDLTGSGETLIVKKMAYNDRDLCVQEEVAEQKTITVYDPIFPYLPKRIEKYSHNSLISYLELDYNALGQVEREDDSGSVTSWQYDKRGFFLKRIQETGTDDPDVVTLYTYNNQGRCIEVRVADSVQKNQYDLMGNQIESLVLSSTGTLVDAVYMGYDLNNALIWKQTANEKNTVYFDCHASSSVKATRQMLSPSRLVAYTLYDYDSSGYLIEETDPRGYTTYRDYDAVGRVIAETKEGQTVLFSYEPGGLVSESTSPTGGKTARTYTANGLLKEESYPDGTKHQVVYDCFGRPVLETKDGIAWGWEYDDAHHLVVRTHLMTKNTEVSEFNARGNRIRFTDAAGYASERTYDGLNRVKTETTPSGQKTTWGYQGDLVICTRPSGETTTYRYEGSRMVESETTDSLGVLIAKTTVHMDPTQDKQTVTQGGETTVTWKNALGLPIRVEKGSTIATYEYDAQGNCLISTDGDGLSTRYVFDGLSRLMSKELPDGTRIRYDYDLESNLIRYHLPNGTIWMASYDSMGRKCHEELQAKNASSNLWDFIYENGYLKKTIDPLRRTHTYLYDSYGRLKEDLVEGGRRTYTYDQRGLLVMAQQTTDLGAHWLSSWVYGPTTDQSLLERSYDADGRLIQESTYLNAILIQRTHQQWTPSARSLQTGSHRRDFTYQNNHLAKVATQHAALSYAYDLSGSLIKKESRLAKITTDYNTAGLPEKVLTHLSCDSYQEALEWYPSGKLCTYASPERQKQFTYNDRGYLMSTGTEEYEFDFGSSGTGVRTGAPSWSVPQGGLDEFGKIRASITKKIAVKTGYDAMGQVISQDQRQFTWDPWGRLLKVTAPDFTWEASYDALGRRLETRYTKGWNKTVKTISFYDPEVEFQEIGIRMENKVFWKLYGPSSCDALTDDKGTLVILVHNSLGQLSAAISDQKTAYPDSFLSAYGPQEDILSIPPDLLAYALSLSWQSKSQDPTGLIWMGERYYDAKSGRFLSPDSVSYPLCLDLYTYANGDPINYIDPDGRFFSPAYQTNKTLVLYSSGLQNMYEGVNTAVAQYAKLGKAGSYPFEVGSFDLPNGAIGFTNGIDNQPADSWNSAERLSQYAGGAKIYAVYNKTHSLVPDVLECLAGLCGFHSPPVEFIKNRWSRFISTHGPEAKILEVCHSGGAIHIRNALTSSPEAVRQRVIVLAVAPATVVSDKLCFRSYNCVSQKDIVPYFDFMRTMFRKRQLHKLQPHANAKGLDHEFLSPTFAETIEKYIVNYIKDYGGE